MTYLITGVLLHNLVCLTIEMGIDWKSIQL